MPIDAVLSSVRLPIGVVRLSSIRLPIGVVRLSTIRLPIGVVRLPTVRAVPRCVVLRCVVRLRLAVVLLFFVLAGLLHVLRLVLVCATLTDGGGGGRRRRRRRAVGVHRHLLHHRLPELPVYPHRFAQLFVRKHVRHCNDAVFKVVHAPADVLHEVVKLIHVVGRKPHGGVSGVRFGGARAAVGCLQRGSRGSEALHQGPCHGGVQFPHAHAPQHGHQLLVRRPHGGQRRAELLQQLHFLLRQLGFGGKLHRPRRARPAQAHHFRLPQRGFQLRVRLLKLRRRRRHGRCHHGLLCGVPRGAVRRRVARVRRRADAQRRRRAVHGGVERLAAAGRADDEAVSECLRELSRNHDPPPRLERRLLPLQPEFAFKPSFWFHPRRRGADVGVQRVGAHRAHRAGVAGNRTDGARHTCHIGAAVQRRNVVLPVRGLGFGDTVASVQNIAFR